jgi:phage baseplate assembly protein W
VALQAQPNLIERELEVNIQGFISGPNLPDLADKMIREIENAINKFEPTLSLKQVQTEMDAHGEHNICSFLLIFETSYEEFLWKPQ